MRETRVSIPELAMIAGTRGMAGAGIGLLLAEHLGESQRKAVGWTLVLVGVLTTIPLAFEIFGSGRLTEEEEWSHESRERMPAYSG